jgi:hydrogenase maturation protease
LNALVLGIGNLLISDEGVGCITVDNLNARYQMPPEVECLDGGTAGFELLPLIDSKDHLILIDALRNDMAPGTVVMIEDEDVPRSFLSSISPHQLGISDVLAAAALTDILPKKMILLGVEPKQLEVGIGLSPEVENGMEKIIDTVVEQLRNFGYEVEENGIESKH